jgi:hypothetical protein
MLFNTHKTFDEISIETNLNMNSEKIFKNKAKKL